MMPSELLMDKYYVQKHEPQEEVAEETSISEDED